MRLTVWLQRLWARLYYVQGGIYRYWGNKYGHRWAHLEAVESFSQALALDPNFARVYLDRGILYWRELDHPRRAIMDLTKAEELDPRLTEARFNRGIAYQQLREYEQAVGDFRAYLAIGDHPYWRQYAERMLVELSEWVRDAEGGE